MSLKEEILSLIEKGEGPTIDFKEKKFLNEPHKVAKTLSSFANHEGGKILMGVNDDGVIAEEKIDNQDIERIMTISSNNCKPPILPQVEIVHFDEGDVCYIHIPKAPLPIKANDRWYIRHGNTTRTMEFDEIKKYPAVEITPTSETIDIQSILSEESNNKTIYEDGRAVPYVESRMYKSDGATCIIYANTFNHFRGTTYYLEKSFPRITIDNLKKIIEKYYSIFQYDHHVAAFGISQGNYNWFGYGPLNFLDALENQDHRYVKMKNNGSYIHHREACCFIDELNDSIFYIHAQPNRKSRTDEKVTLDYLTVGFMFNNIPYDNIYRYFFKSIGSIPQFIDEVHEDLTVSREIDSEFTGDDYVIESFGFDRENWVCGMITSNFNKHTKTYTDKLIINLKNYHPLGEKRRYKASNVIYTEIPVGGFQAVIVNYKGNW
ncbi:ATP-binding protein [uncultured Methanolobus sp.]|uniref:AlbA family DNA-binding domain-containing protein n=1 Tax=uncultured Methanolobus sp. TaxID=218300 RepID=UPI002AABB510|nr:ATP-binding protein [uncultured Methanolobus sp.]